MLQKKLVKLGMVGAVCAAVALSSGCVVTTKASVGSPRMADAKLVPAVYRPVLEVSNEKVSGKSVTERSLDISIIPGLSSGSADTSSSEAFFKGLSPAEEQALRLALQDACKSSGADFLMAPRYEMKKTEYKDFYRKVECKVTGWPAKIVGVEKVPD